MPESKGAGSLRIREVGERTFSAKFPGLWSIPTPSVSTDSAQEVPCETSKGTGLEQPWSSDECTRPVRRRREGARTTLSPEAVTAGKAFRGGISVRGFEG